MNGWFGFWIFLAALIVCDHWIFSQGYDSFFQQHKTTEEKELQRLKIEERRMHIEVMKRKAPTSAPERPA